MRSTRTGPVRRRRVAGGAAALLALGAALAAVPAPVVAADGGGCANAAIRAQQGADGLPDCRAFELVSPQAKGNTDVAGEVFRSATQASVDGNAVVFSSTGAIPGATRGGALPFTYRAVRGAGGWATEAVTPPSRSTWANCGSCGPGNTGQVLWFTPDLERALVATNWPLVPGASDATNFFSQRNPGSDYALLTPGGPTAVDVVGASNEYIYFQGATDDLRHVLFTTAHAMAPGAVHQINSPGLVSLYEVSDGVVRLVSIDEHGDPILGKEVRLGSRSDPNEITRSDAQHAVSRDGSRIFFQAGDTLYLRKDHATTVVLPGGKAFHAADPDGARAVYRSTAGLQRYDVATQAVDDICVGIGDCKFVTASEDAETVYFADGREHVAGQPAIPSGSDGLYRWHAGTTQYVATIGPFPAGLNQYDFRTYSAYVSSSTMTRSPDGDVLVFATPSSVNGDAHAGRYQVYRYDARTDELTCISCPPAGAPQSDAFLYHTPASWLGSTYQHPLGNRNNVSTDGRRIFFQTADALVPSDVNGKLDVYAWEDGEVRLVSRGSGKYDTRFLSASPSGDDVFVVTREQLVPEDRDDFVDVYDVRVGGGAARMASVAPCEGDACQGPPSGSPELASPGTRTFSAAQAVPAPRAAVQARISVPRTVRGATVRAAVRVSQAGRIRVSGAGARSVQRTVGRAGTYRIAVGLSPKGRTALARKRRLAVTLTIRFTPARGAAKVLRARVTFTANVARPATRSGTRAKGGAR